MTKKVKITIIVSAILVVLALIVSLFIYSLSPVSKKSEKVIFSVTTGTSKIDIIDDLKEAGLIKSKISAYIFVFLGGKNLQAGVYQIDRNESLNEIINKISSGKIYRETYTMTFVEGKRLTKYASQIADKLDISEKEVINTLNDKEYLKELIDKYWFLTNEILNDDLYYPLEGYLFPAKYEFFSDASVKDIAERMLDAMGKRLEPYKEEIENSKYSIHEILSMASIIELEAVSKSDRQKVSQVIYRRLQKNWSLGMDVTAYYGVQKEMGETLYKSELNDNNPYNTRLTSKLGLPVGPICNPSLGSIDAVFNPTNTDYMFFYADIKTGIVYFAKTSDEFAKLIKEIGGN